MKSTLICLGLGSFLTLHALGAGTEAIIKQRAKDLSNQNNVRQGVAPPGQPAQAARPTAPAATALPPAAKLQADIAAIKPGSVVIAAQKQQLARDLTALAQGSTRPSTGAVNKLAEDLAAALAQKGLPEGPRGRLVQDLTAVVNPVGIKPDQMQEIISDVQAVFQSNGSTRKEAVAIADDVKALAAETQKTAAK